MKQSIQGNIMDTDVYAIIAVQSPDGDVRIESIGNELIVDAVSRMVNNQPDCKIRLFLKQVHPKFFSHCNVEVVY
ncbi:hypothetical protein [Desulforamulus reducens]|uniref:hypothetical protein n=1 Tax=Desulforamulus reducens TaxID=59610 RepID=UPI0002F8D419|nr:hypothetical protein [Desulforamulus reducens]